MSRREQVLDAALDLIEREGEGALTMRALAAAVGIRAPSLYRHFPDKAALEAALAARGLELLRARAPADGDLLAQLRAYRAFARDHPALYRLLTDRPLRRDLLPAGLEDAAAAPLVRATGSRVRARAAWALVHGLVALEQAGRFPDDADLDAVLAAAAAALHADPAPG